MSPKNGPGSRKKPTFIEQARREQIIDATIDTVAQKGFVNASLAEIANMADISKPIIRYYFGCKDELIEQTLNTLYAAAGAFVRSRVEAQMTASDKVRTYITAQLEYVRDHRREAVADWELLSSFDSAEAKRSFNKTLYNPIRTYMSEILSQGQETGEFGEFSVASVASLILGALDGIILQWVFDPEAADLDQCGQALLDMVEPFLLNG